MAKFQNFYFPVLFFDLILRNKNSVINFIERDLESFSLFKTNLVGIPPRQKTREKKTKTEEIFFGTQKKEKNSSPERRAEFIGNITSGISIAPFTCLNFKTFYFPREKKKKRKENLSNERLPLYYILFQFQTGKKVTSIFVFRKNKEKPH